MNYVCGNNDVKSLSRIVYFQNIALFEFHVFKFAVFLFGLFNHLPGKIRYNKTVTIFGDNSRQKSRPASALENVVFWQNKPLNRLYQLFMSFTVYYFCKNIINSRSFLSHIFYGTIPAIGLYIAVAFRRHRYYKFNP